ncbi:LPP20 family lipoprotein [Sulfurimonas sp. SAG-AH-194-C20]|nr:LPP20 family lipoprotein [Sulfurimonas sp. SAG-AH-194-C20]MDF1878259.1 LPP20 family lipoprotein [Sulfurimonas sp. SAG-AH-194-C20]
MKKVQLLIVVLFLSFTACSSSPKLKDSNSMPSWVHNPSEQGKIGAVGVARRTYDSSLSTQRKLAIKRALDELALQANVKVKIRMTKEETVTNSKTTLKTKDYSTYGANETISAYIKDTWMDRSSNELYIWMLMDK